MYCPEFNKVDSCFFTKKAKLVPKLPQSIDELKDLPDIYKETKKKLRFLASSTSIFNKFITFASLIMLTILAVSKRWCCDGTFKSAPAHFYQHYIIDGHYKGWPLPGCFSFLSGKSYDIYNLMLTNLKEAGLILAPKEIFVDFEQGAIKAFKFHFPGAKITGCHFHFSELGMKKLYSENNKFKTWV